jgi:hypothetical protein
MRYIFFLWERHLAAKIVAGSHSHKGKTSLPIGRRGAGDVLLKAHSASPQGTPCRSLKLPPA